MPVLENGQRVDLAEILRALAATAGRAPQSGAAGKRNTLRLAKAGRRRGHTAAGRLPQDALDLPATLRAAAPHQAGDAPLPLHIGRGDLRYRRFAAPEKTGVLFVVDASRSQGAKKRLAFAKGAILALLRQIYTRRDCAGLIVFGDKTARLALPFTRSVEYAAEQLAGLCAAGNTPLGMGLRLALEQARPQQSRAGCQGVLLVVVTDGKANYDERAGSPLALALEAAAAIRAEQIPAVVVDTERGVFSLGLARRLAEEMGARYLLME